MWDPGRVSNALPNPLLLSKEGVLVDTIAWLYFCPPPPPPQKFSRPPFNFLPMHLTAIYVLTFPIQLVKTHL